MQSAFQFHIMQFFFFPLLTIEFIFDKKIISKSNQNTNGYGTLFANIEWYHFSRNQFGINNRMDFFFAFKIVIRVLRSCYSITTSKQAMWNNYLFFLTIQLKTHPFWIENNERKPIAKTKSFL